MSDKNAEEHYNKRALTISEAAEYACVSRGTIQYWLNKGMLPFEELPSIGLGTYRFRRIRKEDIDEFLDQFYRKSKSLLEKESKNKLILLPKGNT